MKIFVVGTRGIPDIPGGVETHCQQLYPYIASQGHEVLVSRRTPYVDDECSKWKGVSLQNIYSPKKKSIEAIVGNRFVESNMRLTKYLSSELPEKEYSVK